MTDSSKDRTPDRAPNQADQAANRPTLGVVSFLNARPLIAGLAADPALSLRFAVPSALPDMLRQAQVTAALIPVVDLARNDGLFKSISDCCIASDGRTMTVRVFSRVRPEEITAIHVDSDSHTSVVLGQLIWRQTYGTSPDIRPLKTAEELATCEAVLLIGDKVVTWVPDGFPYEIDLGAAWKTMTGLPFVFAVWAARAADDVRFLEPVLSEARDRGVRQAAQIAASHGPKLGWPIDAATTYLVDLLKFRLDPPMCEGMNLFLKLAREHDLLPAGPDPVPA